MTLNRQGFLFTGDKFPVASSFATCMGQFVCDKVVYWGIYDLLSMLEES